MLLLRLAVWQSYANAIREVRARKTSRSEERTVLGYAAVNAMREGKAQARSLHGELH